MTIAFHAPSPWVEISRRATMSRRAFVAVPYLGRGASTQLPLARGSKLVTCLSEAAVAAGVLDPRELLEYLKAGVDVYHQPTLHAKVYVLGRTAFVGSANLSARSAGLVEACVRTTDPNIVQQVKTFVLGLCTNPVTPTTIKALVPHYRPPRVSPRSSPDIQRSVTGPASPRLWVSPTRDAAWEPAEAAAERRAWPSALARLSDSNRFLLEPVAHDGPVRFTVGDLITLRWNHGRGFRFQHPSKIVWAERVSETDGTILFLERPKYRRDVLSTRVRQVLNGSAASFLQRGDAERAVPPSAIAPFLQLWDR